MAARALSYSSSSSGEEDDTFSAFQVMPRPPTEKPLLSPAPATSQESGGSGEVASSDEIGENGVLLERQHASPNKKGVANSPPPKENKAAKGNAAAPAAAAQEEDASAAADSDAETMTPPPTELADEVSSLDGVVLPPPPPQKKKEEPYDAEKHLMDKSDKYPHLWQMVLALEKEYSFPLKKAFLKLTEARAAKLNGKVKNLCLKEVRNQLRRSENDRAVVTALMELIQ